MTCSDITHEYCSDLILGDFHFADECIGNSPTNIDWLSFSSLFGADSL